MHLTAVLLLAAAEEHVGATPINPSNPNLVTAVFEATAVRPEEHAGKPMRAFLYYDKTLPMNFRPPTSISDRYDGITGKNMGMGVVGPSGVLYQWPGLGMQISIDHPEEAYFPPEEASRAHSLYVSSLFYDRELIRLRRMQFPTGSLPPSIPSFDETVSAIGGAGFDVGVINSVHPITVEDILRDSIYAAAAGPTMNARFQPFGGAMSLQDAALLLGVDHFNWVQTVHGPGNVQIQIWDSPEVSEVVNNTNEVTAGTFIASLTEAVDPLPLESGREQFVLRVDGNELNDVKYRLVNIPKPTPDALPFYYNESESYLATKQDDFTLRFRDTPRVRDWVLSGSDGEAAPNFYLTFTTTLVGVRNGKIVDFNVPGTSFRWKSNAVFDDTYESGGIARFDYFKTDQDDNAPPITSGGVFDVEFIGVPEPSTFATCLVILTIACCGRYRHPKAQKFQSP